MYGSRYVYLRQAFLTALITSTFSAPTFASYIQSAVNNAVLKDASAAYYNPASMALLQNKQLLGALVESEVYLNFKGTVTRRLTGTSETGTASSTTFYTLPYIYYVQPLTPKISVGIGRIYNFYGIQDFSPNSILRNIQTYSFISTADYFPAISYKVNDQLTVGGGLDFQYVKLNLSSMVRTLPSIPETKLVNEGNDWGMGGHIGILYRPAKATLIGVTYRTAVSYNISGHSKFLSNPPFISDHFKTKIVAPASQMVTLAQYFSPQFGIIATIERTQWNLGRNLNLRNVALRLGPNGIIIPSVVIPSYLKNTFRYSLTGDYNINPQWYVRPVAAYDQDPGNRYYQVFGGDNIIFGGIVGYRANKCFEGDLAYYKIIYKNRFIDAVNVVQYDAVGRTRGGRNTLVGRLIWNIL